MTFFVYRQTLLLINSTHDEVNHHVHVFQALKEFTYKHPLPPENTLIVFLTSDGHIWNMGAALDYYYNSWPSFFWTHTRRSLVCVDAFFWNNVSIQVIKQSNETYYINAEVNNEGVSRDVFLNPHLLQKFPDNYLYWGGTYTGDQFTLEVTGINWWMVTGLKVVLFDDFLKKYKNKLFYYYDGKQFLPIS